MPPEGGDGDGYDDEGEGSIGTESSGSDGDGGSTANLARLKYPSDDGSGSGTDEDEGEYYGEPAMTILTPITEMDEMMTEVGSGVGSDTGSEGRGESDDSDGVSEAGETYSEAETYSEVEGSLSVGSSRGEAPSLDATEQDPAGIGRVGRRPGGHVGEGEIMTVFEAARRAGANDPTLPTIRLDGSRLRDPDAAGLLRLLRENSSVGCVSLADNELGDRSAEALARALEANGTITSVSLKGNRIGNRGALALKRALRSNRTLVHLDLNGNDIDSYVLDGLRQCSSAVAPADPSSPLDETEPIVDEAEDDPVVPEKDQRSQIHSSNGSDYIKLFVSAEKGIKTRGKDTRKAFLRAFSSAQKSSKRTQGEESLLLAASLALTRLDAEWVLSTSSGEEAGRPATTRHTLGERERLTPWKKSVTIENLRSIEDEAPNRRASRSLQRMNSTKWRDSISRPSSIRSSILSVSNQTINEALEGGSEARRLSVSGYSLRSNFDLKNMEKKQQWASSFKKLDPRWQIRKFFNDMSVFGNVLSGVTRSDQPSKSTAIFTIWRPTSEDAIAKMMRGEGVGKGLEIKGKSARTGELSGYIPFLQIHEEEHKRKIRTVRKGDRTKIFFASHRSRDRVGAYLGQVAKEMTLQVAQAKFALARAKFGCEPDAILREELNYAANTLSLELENPRVLSDDTYAPDMYCVEVSARVLWEGLVGRKDISRIPGSRLDTGRASQPAFQDMNFAALRRQKSDEPHPVLFQTSEDDPFEARTLVMAYEELGKVVPVVSDFDCFLIGSRDFSYRDPMSPEQVELLDWCISQIEWVLDNHSGPDCWTTSWLEVLKYAARNGFYPSMPKFGFGDPTSYSMIEASVQRSAKTCGAVRHGPECFNFFFPQDLDDRFLIVFPGDQIWKYVNEKELRSILREKIREGYTFPLNPKWLLCDPGWITLFRDLLESDRSSVQDSINLWFPPSSGLRERILDIHKKFPNGFQRDDQVRKNQSLAEEEYARYLILQRARRKMRGFIYWRNLLLDVRQRAASNAEENCRSTSKDFKFLGKQTARQLSLKKGDVEDETIKEIEKFDFFGDDGDVDFY